MCYFQMYVIRGWFTVPMLSDNSFIGSDPKKHREGWDMKNGYPL